MDISKYTKRLQLDPKKFGFGGAPGGADKAVPSDPTQVVKKEAVDQSSSYARVLTGTPSIIEEYYFPTDLIGGSCPRVVGEEEEIVWNAAAEACDTERVHVVWQSVANKIWYLAVRSNDLASHANTWCPFAAVLPGMKSAGVPPVCYTYYSDETATMMAVTPDGLQIYRGTSLVVRAKAERTSRELGDAPIIELIPDLILQMTPMPWYSVSLFEDRARRILASVAAFTAIGLIVLSFLVWLLASMTLLTTRHGLTETLARTDDATMDLMHMVEKTRNSPMRQQLGDFASINDGLINLNGLLEVYEIKDGHTRWKAIIPPNVTADRISDIHGKTIEMKADGAIIGNDDEIRYEATAAGKK
jgi:hypothetical protein